MQPLQIAAIVGWGLFMFSPLLWRPLYNRKQSKWTELRETIWELNINNTDKPDVENVTRFLLNLMDVLDAKE